MNELGGLCYCGCGNKAPISKQTVRRAGVLMVRRGESQKFIFGHQARKPDIYTIEDRGYKTPCWIWTKCQGGRGYGYKFNGTRNVPAHIVYYEQKHGSVPKGLELDHLCRIRNCINPDHVEAVSHAENVRRSPLLTNLTMESAQEIRRLRSSGMKYTSIAAIMGTTKIAVGFICRGQTWKE